MNFVSFIIVIASISAIASISENDSSASIQVFTKDKIPIHPKDNTCPSERSGVVNFLDITDCKNGFPCTIHRERRYFATFNFSPKLDTAFMRIKCGTQYLGRPNTLRDINVCEHMTEGSCPMTGGQNYSYTTSFRIPYFVPPTSYNIACQLADDTGINTMCGSGVARLT